MMTKKNQIKLIINKKKLILDFVLFIIYKILSINTFPIISLSAFVTQTQGGNHFSKSIRLFQLK